MFITVKYGNNESLLCNPSCAVVNLLSNIKRRTGFSKKGALLDLSDEKGLIKELDLHRYDYADKYLTSHGTYILVEKQPIIENDGSNTPEFQYLPLLDDAENVFPDFRLHVHAIEKKTKKGRTKSQSPSPAGVKGLKGHAKHSKAPARAPSRKR